MAKENTHHLYKNKQTGKVAMYTAAQHAAISNSANYKQFRAENVYLGECDENGTPISAEEGKPGKKKPAANDHE
jgi:hypothetical protein